MSDTPDFDNMSQEEIMLWMESLAKRQGTTEGLTTSADMAVNEVDANDERLQDLPEYKPYGMSDEEWARRKAQEDEERAQRIAAIKEQEQAAPPQPMPEPEPEPPAPEPVAAQPAASADEGTPDFDNMSQEEIMLWMESLAKRQGTTEGLTTSADMAVEEVDANDERLQDLPEYKPYGMSDEEWERRKAQEDEERAQRIAAIKEQESAPVTPMAEPDDAPDDFAAALEGDVLAAPNFDDIFGGNNEIIDDVDESLPDFSLDSGPPTLDQEPEETDLSALFGAMDDAAQDAPAQQNSMDWLADLAGGDSDSEELDLSALGDLAGLGDNDEEAADPMGWLSELAGTDDNDLVAEEGTANWMETLASRQGADAEELATNADLNLPDLGAAADSGPGYEPYSFNDISTEETADDEDTMPIASFDPAQMDLDNPEDWLDGLAAGVAQGDETQAEEFDLSFMEQAAAEDNPDFASSSSDLSAKLSDGSVSPEDVESFFSAAFSHAEQRGDVPDYIDDIEDEEGEIVEAEIPDWLSEAMDRPPSDDAQRKRDTAEMMIDQLNLDDPEMGQEIPDWLQPDNIAEEPSEDFSDIFGSEIADEVPAATIEALEDLPSDAKDDTWVTAFGDEEDGAMAQWYQQRLRELDDGSTEAQPAAEVDAEAVAAVLQQANLPVESSLAEGSAMAVPDWLLGEAQAAAPLDLQQVSQETAQIAEPDLSWLSGMDEVDVATDDMPDWLAEQVDDSVAPETKMPDWLMSGDVDLDEIEADDIPDWLRDTMDGEEAALTAESEALFEEPPAAPTPQPQAIAPAQQSPAPVPSFAANIDVAATLQAAQSKVESSDIDGALMDYEAVVRANTALDQVENAMSKLVAHKSHQKNPGVYRVLGDTLMRQGKLQEALDTYRRALNLL